MLDAMGIDTGIDLEKLFSVRNILSEVLSEEPLYGYTAYDGLPIGYQPQIKVIN